MITLNGEKIALKTEQNLQDFLADHGYEGKVFAVALNGGFLPKTTYDVTILKSGDDLEIVAPMQGG